MNEPLRTWDAPGELRIDLDCGHRVTVPWGSDPAVGAAMLVHHESECTAARLPVADGWPSSAPWAVPRRGPSR